ncbi:MAG: nitronate monooxygenase family protein [Candidatus Omnitrophica bacterium]|nr:nitronate monooxygenase family protein [Candidatus Omnitrophota bacterium]MBU4479434.1 nitronate monooxygenase family protein [Candidatus Omnitrophota bacterium]MCG2703175.1 nitronate monooxygenase family protein [Candidatus Omnitrophota bacterium]
MANKLKPLQIGSLEIKVPIIQGGMGVAVSTASLASAVANCGGAGTIASVGLGFSAGISEKEFMKASREGLAQEIRKSKTLTPGVVGVNILVALNNYEDLVRTAAVEKADFIASGAGLPLKLPEFTVGSAIKLFPIVSSPRAAGIIIKTWKNRYNRFPDAIIVEGPMAGGHLGFSFDEMQTMDEYSLERLVSDVLKITSEYEQEYNVVIPVIAAGGIFTGKDIANFIRLGASAVQMATRFVATFECSIHEKFKKLYVEAKEEDTVIIKSPVGMPGRSLKTDFVKRMEEGKREAVRCKYRCLRTCDPVKTPYCIAKALLNAVSGDIDNAVVFAGSNVFRIKNIVSVKELMDELTAEAAEELDKQQLSF